MRRHQGAKVEHFDVNNLKVEHFDVSNVIYHKFSYGVVSYMLNGENVNVMLEFFMKTYCNPSFEPSQGLY